MLMTTNPYIQRLNKYNSRGSNNYIKNDKGVVKIGYERICREYKRAPFAKPNHFKQPITAVILIQIVSDC